MISHNGSYRRIQTSLKISFMLIAMALASIGTNMLLASRLPPLLATGLFQRRSREQLVMSIVTASDRNIPLLENDHDGMLHIVTTRFMQEQPNLVELGKARLALFETFCLPTMIGQEADNFLWFVMIDPNLDSRLLQRLQVLLSPYPNFFLIASNAKLLSPLNLTVGSPMHDHLILTGDTKMLYTKMFDLHRPLLVETRLDADDGLHKRALLDIQNIAFQLPVDSRGWQIVCARIHFEWRNYAIGAKEIGNITHNLMDQMTSGRLRVVKEGLCVTPGYTLVKHREAENIEFPPWPKIGHHLITRDWPECSSIGGGAIPANSAITKDSGGVDDSITYNCWKKIGQYPAALRSRTITSAGMSRIESNPMGTIYENQTEMFWGFVKRDFGIRPEQALSTSQYLQNHFVEIASENLKGQW
jgi:Putative rhamnosyl transferase